MYLVCPCLGGWSALWTAVRAAAGRASGGSTASGHCLNQGQPAAGPGARSGSLHAQKCPLKPPRAGCWLPAFQGKSAHSTAIKRPVWQATGKSTPSSDCLMLSLDEGARSCVYYAAHAVNNYEIRTCRISIKHAPTGTYARVAAARGHQAPQQPAPRSAGAPGPCSRRRPGPAAPRSPSRVHSCPQNRPKYCPTSCAFSDPNPGRGPPWGSTTTTFASPPTRHGLSTVHGIGHSASSATSPAPECQNRPETADTVSVAYVPSEQ